MNAACGRGSIRRANYALADRRRVCLCLKSKNYNHEGCREGGDQLHDEEVLCEVSVLTLWYPVLPFASYTAQRLCMGTVLLCTASSHMRTLVILFIAVPLITVVRSRECIIIPGSYTVYPDMQMIGMKCNQLYTCVRALLLYSHHELRRYEIRCFPSWSRENLACSAIHIRRPRLVTIKLLQEYKSFMQSVYGQFVSTICHGRLLKPMYLPPITGVRVMANQ